MRNFYEKHISPHLLNYVMQLPLFKKQRKKVIPFAKGKILEVGFGSGLNLPYYNLEILDSLTALDPNPILGKYAKKRSKKYKLPYKAIELSAEKIPYTDNSFDTVVCTYSLCTIPDPVAAIKEIKRVLKPGGKFLFTEHGLAPDNHIRKWQTLLNPIEKTIAGGCNLNRDIPAIIRKGGLALTNLKEDYISAHLKILTYNYWGHAIKQ